MTWEEVVAEETETLLWFAGTEYGAGPGIGALRRGRLGSGESLKQLSAKLQDIIYVSPLAGTLEIGGVPVGDCEDMLHA